jgi:hypothetical protein
MIAGLDDDAWVQRCLGCVGSHRRQHSDLVIRQHAAQRPEVGEVGDSLRRRRVAGVPDVDHQAPWACRTRHCAGVVRQGNAQAAYGKRAGRLQQWTRGLPDTCG